MTTIFEKIIKGELPAKRVFENERLLVIEDRFPKAPVHLLIIPKKPIVNLQDLKREDYFLLPEIVAVAQELARKFNMEEGYRFSTNNGKEGGQEVFHLHFHLMGWPQDET